jgi:hypothetical protein
VEEVLVNVSDSSYVKALSINYMLQYSVHYFEMNFLKLTRQFLVRNI